MHLARPRHIIVSLLIFLLLGGSGMLVGMASATQQPATDAAPFVMAAPRIGDRGEYTFQKAELDADSIYRGFHPDRALEFGFEVLAPQVSYATDGSAHWTWGLSLTVFDDRDGERVARDDRILWIEDMDVIVSDATTIREDEPRTTEGAIPGLLDEESTGQTMMRFIDPGSMEVPPCALAHPYAGRALPAIGVPVDEVGGCRPDWNVPVDKHQMVVRGVTQTEPPMVIIDHYGMHPSDQVTDRSIPDWTSWHLPDIPYPVRILDVRGGEFGAPGDVMALTGFERGTEAFPPAPQMQPLPALRTRAPTAIVVDETGIDHPFPLSEAVRRARDDPQNRDLAAFLSAHPEAFLGMARHAAFDVEGQHKERWEMIWTTGSTHHRLHVHQVTDSDALLPTTTYSTDTEDVDHYADERFMDPARLEAVPTVASMLAQWRIAGAGTAHPDATESYAFWLMCYEECDPADARFLAGSVYYYRISEGIIAGDRQDTWHTSEMMFSAESLQHLALSEQDHFVTRKPPVAPPATSDDPEGLASVAPVGWGWPTPATTATIAGGALIIALAYYLSPLLKTGFIGLFSRVRHDQILDHPQRRLIMDTIADRPGIHMKELLRQTGQENGVTKHHLDKLLDARKVTAAKQGGYTCYFPAGQVDHQIMHSIAAIKSEGARAVLRGAALRPGASISELAQSAGIRPQTAHYHVQRLSEARLVETVKDGSISKVIPTAAAKQALALT